MDVILAVWSADSDDVHSYVEYIEGVVNDLSVKVIKYDHPIPREIIKSLDRQVATSLSHKDTGSTNLQIHFEDSNLTLALVGYNHHNGCYPHEFVVRYNRNYRITDEGSI